MASVSAQVVTVDITSVPAFSQTSELYQYLDAARAYQPTETSSSFAGITLSEAVPVQGS